MIKILFKIFFVSIITVVSLSLRLPSVAHATPSDVIHVRGYVTESGHPVPGATVVVACSSQAVAADSLTDAHGFYSATLGLITPCRSDFPITTYAYADDFKKNGAARATLHGTDIRIDVMLGTTIPVPEYGMLDGILAASVGVGVLALARQRFSKTARLLG